jgi:hypothetical protein
VTRFEILKRKARRKGIKNPPAITAWLDARRGSAMAEAPDEAVEGEEAEAEAAVAMETDEEAAEAVAEADEEAAA